MAAAVSSGLYYPIEIWMHCMLLSSLVAPHRPGNALLLISMLQNLPLGEIMSLPYARSFCSQPCSTKLFLCAKPHSTPDIFPFSVEMRSVIRSHQFFMLSVFIEYFHTQHFKACIPSLMLIFFFFRNIYYILKLNTSEKKENSMFSDIIFQASFCLYEIRC